MGDEIEDDYSQSCPFCESSPIRCRDCTNLGCDDGYLDLHDEDPLWYDAGDSEPCPECRGTGIVVWCPKCGKDPRVKGA